MAKIFISRGIQFVIIAIGLATLLFFAMRISGDPARLQLGLDAPEAAVEVLRRQLGYDRPLHIQYFDFIYKLAPHISDGSFEILDFGKSARGSDKAIDLALDRFPYTLMLGVPAFIVAALLSIPLGILSALSRNTLVKSGIMGVALMGQAVPGFVLAILLVFFFGVYLKILPIFGFEGWKSLVLPAMALAAFPLARLTRLLRSQIMETIPQDYVRTARAKGLPNVTVIRRHVLSNAIIPWVTLQGLDFGRLMGGSIIVETVFAYPGIGRQLILAIQARDFPVVQADVFLIAMMVVAGNLLADFSYRWLDPRIRSVA